MRQAATLFIFGLLLLVVFLIFLTKSVAIVQRVAVVDSVVGSAELLRGVKGDPIGLEAGKLVRVGDVIHTGPDSSVELRWARWAGGLRLRIGPNTSFTVTRAVFDRSTGREESRLRVDEGTVWIRLREALSGRSKFAVETPTAVASVRGTVFSVTVQPDGASTISVWKGKVAVSAGGSAEVTIAGGSRVIVGGEGLVPPPRSLTEAERREWRAQHSIVGPFLAVASPAEGAALEATLCTVSGRTEGDCDVFLNGAPLLLSDKAEFTGTLELSPGEHRIEVVARAADGSKTTVTRTVTVPQANGAP